jgi:uncharacterized membrane protein YraQ (UPF0718 family)
MKQEKNKTKKNLFGISFLLIMLCIYAIMFITDSGSFSQSLHYVGTVLYTLIPVLILVFVIMSVFHYYLKPKTISKYLGVDAGWKGWFLSTIFGIFSHGSIYMWYPLFQQIHQKGMSYGFIAVFLYNRSVKIPLLPALILYFGLTYTVVLLVWMIIAGLIEGKIITVILDQPVSTIQ